jgi:hypothetical protein
VNGEERKQTDIKISMAELLHKLIELDPGPRPCQAQGKDQAARVNRP